MPVSSGKKAGAQPGFRMTVPKSTARTQVVRYVVYVLIHRRTIKKSRADVLTSSADVRGFLRQEVLQAEPTDLVMRHAQRRLPSFMACYRRCLNNYQHMVPVPDLAVVSHTSSISQMTLVIISAYTGKPES